MWRDPVGAPCMNSGQHIGEFYGQSQLTCHFMQVSTCNAYLCFALKRNCGFLKSEATETSLTYTSSAFITPKSALFIL